DAAIGLGLRRMHKDSVLLIQRDVDVVQWRGEVLEIAERLRLGRLGEVREHQTTGVRHVVCGRHRRVSTRAASDGECEEWHSSFHVQPQLSYVEESGSGEKDGTESRTRTSSRAQWRRVRRRPARRRGGIETHIRYESRIV